MKNIAVVLAGGVGSRMGYSLPKQFLPLSERTVIECSIDTFNEHPAIDEVAVVMHPEWREYFYTIEKRNHWEKLKKVIDGGNERYMSSINAIMAYNDYPDDTNLLLHDAARPWVSSEIIDRVIDALTRHEAVGVAVPSLDTIWEVHPDMSSSVEDIRSEYGIPRYVAHIPERKIMWRAQTPQAFRLPLIRDAYQRALQDLRFHATDDCGVVRKYIPGTKICVVQGEEENRKITYRKDIDEVE